MTEARSRLEAGCPQHWLEDRLVSGREQVKWAQQLHCTGPEAAAGPLDTGLEDGAGTQPLVEVQYRRGQAGAWAGTDLRLHLQLVANDQLEVGPQLPAGLEAAAVVAVAVVAAAAVVAAVIAVEIFVAVDVVW